MSHEKDRAFIAEGRAHDEAMTDGPWIGGADSVWLYRPGTPGVVIAEIVQPEKHEANAAGIAWFGTHRRELLAGYERALDRIDCLAAELSGARKAADWSETKRCELLTERDGLQAEVDRLRAEVAKEATLASADLDLTEWLCEAVFAAVAADRQLLHPITDLRDRIRLVIKLARRKDA